MSSRPSFLPTYRRLLWRQHCRPLRNLRLHQKIFLCRSRRRRPTSSRSMWKRQLLHQRNLRLQKFTPIKAPQAAGRPGPMSISSAKALATYAPRPQYPYEARSRHVTGSGVCVVEVGPSGSVTSASMAQSIGNPILDNAATSAFRQWRFKPGSVSKVKIPITFTMTGAQY